MPRFADQRRQPYHAQVASLALRVPAPRPVSGSGGGDVCVKVGSVERQHIGRQLKPPYHRSCNLDLSPLQLLITDPCRLPVKRLPGECGGRQAGDAWQARFEKSCQMAFGRRRTGTLYRHGEDHFAYRRPPRGYPRRTRLIDEPDQIELLGNPY